MRSCPIGSATYSIQGWVGERTEARATIGLGRT
jgi:hypothetical protein